MPDRAERENPRAERRPHSEKRAALERGRQGTEADDSGSGKGAELTIGSANRNDGWFQMAEAGKKSWKWVHSFFPTSSGCATMLRALPHNSSAALAMPFLPSASCRNLDLPPVNLRFLQSHLTKNAFAIAPTHLCGIALNIPISSRPLSQYIPPSPLISPFSH